MSEIVANWPPSDAAVRRPGATRGCAVYGVRESTTPHRRDARPATRVGATRADTLAADACFRRRARSAARRRARLGHRNEPPGAARHACTARRPSSSASRATGRRREALERARAAGIETGVFVQADYEDRSARDGAIADWMAERDVELIVLAGYMAILTSAFLSRFAGAVVNVHPSLLPAFPGIRAIEQALDYGVKIFGVTVHFVEDDGGVDTGPIILQRAIELPHATSADEVHERLRPIEHALVPEAVRLDRPRRGDARPAQPAPDAHRAVAQLGRPRARAARYARRRGAAPPPHDRAAATTGRSPRARSPRSAACARRTPAGRGG